MKYKNVFVSSVEDCAENAGGYYCQVETLDGAQVDDFCIHPEELAQNPDVDYWMKQYLDCAYDGYVKEGLVPRFPTLRPASHDEAGLFYSLPPEKDAELGTIGHIRIDFGKSGKEFWSTWWPRGRSELNSPEFKEELDSLMAELRESVLKDMNGMVDYCWEHGTTLLNGRLHEQGFVAESDHYRYCLRCILRQGDYNAYLTCYDKQVQEMAQKPLVGRLRYASGEVQEFTDPEKYIAAFKEELPLKPTTGMTYETLTDDPKVRKAIDDTLHGLFGEENPRPLADYEKTPQNGERSDGTVKTADGLPDLCFTLLPAAGSLICIKRGESCYYLSDWSTPDRAKNRELADFNNEKLGVTKAQEEAMLVGSMIGWDAPGADPKFYEEQGPQMGGMT